MNAQGAVYFIKQRDFSVEDDGALTGLMIGDMPTDALEHLSTISQVFHLPFWIF